MYIGVRVCIYYTLDILTEVFSYTPAVEYPPISQVSSPHISREFSSSVCVCAHQLAVQLEVC